ncbi:MAG: DUF502 domain-containing protein [Alphaproteobacteria bacterium]|jgi:uncharacterized membrane protein|nr:DUF502 domain-containing protein [Alphaproteobacteria bacterium]
MAEEDNKEKKTSRVFYYLRKWFIAGIITSVPLILTIYILLWIIEFFDNLVVIRLFPNTVVSQIPGIGIIASAISMVILGFLASNFLGRYLVKLGERLLQKIPIVKSIYSTIKQLFDTVFSTQSKAFREVVLIEFPRKDIWVLAFITSETKGEIQDKTAEDVVSVYVPTTPNPTSGFLVFIPKKDITFLEMKPDLAMKLILSNGIIDK